MMGQLPKLRPHVALWAEIEMRSGNCRDPGQVVNPPELSGAFEEAIVRRHKGAIELGRERKKGGVVERNAKLAT
jgi:hypothetical protein